MSQLGYERLEEDAVGKMLHYADRLRESQRPMVLHADETNVLLAYIEPPESSFVFVGEGSEAGAQSSSGNLGGHGCWPIEIPSSGTRSPMGLARHRRL